MVIVDWFGRGGIAHTTEAWVRPAQRTGPSHHRLTRAGGSSIDRYLIGSAWGRGGGALIGHAAVVRAAARVAWERSGGTIVLQGSVLPQLARCT